jgi:preprotein translocase SecF subunit
MQESYDYFDFMKLKVAGFILSAILLFASFCSFFINKLSFGIDFTGGLLFDISVDSNIGEFREILNRGEFGDFNVQSYGDNSFIVRISEMQRQDGKINEIKQYINGEFSETGKDVTYNKIDFVGPQVGKDLIKNGLFAFFLSLLVISVYIWVRFELDFSIGVLITLVHDICILFGIYSIFRVDFDLTSVAAILTVMGYSMNDTVVIYDRLREFLQKYKDKSLVEIINRSLTTTLRRTLLTSSTTLISLLILGFWGGDSIKYFSLIVFVGIIIGTYSSIFISAPILIYIKKNNPILDK